jgi:hypothetical protein
MGESSRNDEIFIIEAHPDDVVVTTQYITSMC